jgi:hypothetical protein
MNNSPYAASVHYCPSCDTVRPESDVEFIELVPELGNVARFRCKKCGNTFEELPPSVAPSNMVKDQGGN